MSLRAFRPISFLLALATMGAAGPSPAAAPRVTAGAGEIVSGRVAEHSTGSFRVTRSPGSAPRLCVSIASGTVTASGCAPLEQTTLVPLHSFRTHGVMEGTMRDRRGLIGRASLEFDIDLVAEGAPALYQASELHALPGGSEIFAGASSAVARFAAGRVRISSPFLCTIAAAYYRGRCSNVVGARPRLMVAAFAVTASPTVAATVPV